MTAPVGLDGRAGTCNCRTGSCDCLAGSCDCRAGSCECRAGSCDYEAHIYRGPPFRTHLVSFYDMRGVYFHPDPPWVHFYIDLRPEAGYIHVCPIRGRWLRRIDRRDKLYHIYQLFYQLRVFPLIDLLYCIHPLRYCSLRYIQSPSINCCMISYLTCCSLLYIPSK